MTEPLLEKYSSLDEILNASEEELAKIKGFGPKRAQSIYQFFHCPAGTKLIQEIKSIGLKNVQPKSSGENKEKSALFAGKTIVVTGSLQNFDRLGIESKIKEIGAKAGSSVSSKTDYVLVGDKPGSKVDKAKELGIKIINEAEFLEMLNKTS